MRCDECGKEKNIIIHSGYRLCNECACQGERSTIINIVADKYPDMTRVEIDKILSDMLGTTKYGFPHLKKLHETYPRGGWLIKERCFKVPQNDYILACFADYRRSHFV